MNELLHRTQARLRSAINGLPGLHVVAAADYHARYGVDEAAIADPLRERIAHIPYHDSYYDTLATIVARWVHRQRTPAKKVVVVDCDNTLWGGVVGEVGPEGITVEPQHAALHEALRALAQSGALICLCSKNEEADVWSVFDSRPDLGLRREDIVAAAVNWRPKSENLRSLASRLNLGIDSFVFLDDNPVECAEVRAHCPEVLTLEWPQDAARARLLLQHTWELEPRGATAEDQQRTQMYREEFSRQELRGQTLTFADFISSLDVHIDIAPLSDADLKRASQLTLRTNQFNFTTRRRDESEMRRLANAGRHEIRTVRVKDRFGDYGLVGLLIAEQQEEGVFADTFILSCRVLGRGIEHRMAAEFGKIALDWQAGSVRLRVDPTKRNAPARQFLASIAAVEPDASGALEGAFPAQELAELRYVPNEADAALAIEAESSPAPAAAMPASNVRQREAVIARTAFELSDPAILRAVVEGRSATPASVPAAPSNVGETVYDAFAAALGVPRDTVRQVDRLEALGCTSLKIVEITVALLERYPTLPATLLFEHKSVSDIVRQVRSLIAPDDSRSAISASASVLPQPAGDRSDARFDIAVVGMHLRVGGAESPAELWDLLSTGRSAVAPVPPDRKHFLHPLDGTTPYWASLLPDPGRFDAEFFGVSPREAEFMDPQLRLFLEVAWSALEDAGCVGPEHDPDTGVFAGVMYGDYAHRANIRGGENAYRCWEGFSLANRLSHLLGYSGPSLAVDTACSSSGTALHLACRALADGDCRVAIVGGVNLILDPDRFGSLDRLGILSRRGKCEAFGADADGTALGEGVGVVILRPLADAIARGDRIHGVIKGTGISTGSGTVGFTAPNPQAQSKAIARCLKVAGVDPRTISYVEAHGTGTVLGDPIEVRGLTLAYSNPELQDAASDIPAHCRIGSIKPNIGHLEAGAAVLGLIKVLLQLQRRMLLPSITSPLPNPQIPFDQTPFEVQRALEPWNPPAGIVNGATVTLPRRAGISSFGVGGANAHIIVEEPPEASGHFAGATERSQHLLAISATGETALAQQVSQLRQHLELNPDQPIADLAFSMNTGRQHFGRRMAIRFGDRVELLASVEALSEGRTPKRTATGDASGENVPRIAFLFTGQGSQYAGMGRQLYATQPVFRVALDRCAVIFERLTGKSLRDVLFAEGGSARSALLDQTGFTQPALFAFEYALAQLWQSWGIRPDVVMGHSVGEFAAMCVAGGLSLEDGLTLIAARGRLMQALPAGGAMTSIMAPEDRVLGAIAGVEEQVAIAAINGPGQVVISGAGTVVAEIAARLEDCGIRTKPLTVSHAFHSPLMKPMLAEYEAVVRQVELRMPQIPFVSCVDGALVTTEVTRPEYWIRQIMEPVRFAAGMGVLDAQGIDTFIEIGPQPVLLGMGRQCVGEATNSSWLPSLRKDTDAWSTLLDSVAALYVRGTAIDWKGFDAPYSRTRVPAPTYAFNRKQHWLRMPVATPIAAPRSAASPDQGMAREAAPDGKEQTGPELYRLEWQSAPLTSAAPSVPPRGVSPIGDWIIFADRSGLGAELSAALSAAGAHPVVVVSGARFEHTWDGQYQVNPDSLDDLQQLWTSLRASGVTSASAVHLWGLDSGDSPGLASEAVVVPLTGATNIVRSVTAATTPIRAVWFVTRGAVAPDPAALHHRLAVEQAPLWGFGRTAALEHPDVWGGLIDVSPGEDARRDVTMLARELLLRSGEDQIALRGEARYVARLMPAPAAVATPPAIHANGAYLITGGTGALGLHTGTWLVEQGARRIVLMARGPNASATAAAAAWRERGVNVEIVRADVAVAADVDRVLTRLATAREPLRGIIHAAGIDSEVPLSRLGSRDLAALFAPKAGGAWLLHERTRHIPLDFFVCYSSIASIIGSQGHAHYGAANAALDVLVLERRRLGLPALAINWGPWAGGGMASPEQAARFSKIGNRPIEPAAAVKALGRLLGATDAGVIVADIDWPRFRDVYEARRRRPILASLPTDVPLEATAGEVGIAPAESSGHSASKPAPWIADILAVSDSERLGRLTSLLRSEVADTLGLERAEDVQPDRTLYQMGMDSLMMAGFIGRLRELVGMSCTALVFDHPRIPALAAHLLAQLALAPGAQPVTIAGVPLSTPDEPAAATAPVALIGAISEVSVASPASVTSEARKPAIEGYSPGTESEVFAFQEIAFPDRRAATIPDRWRWMFVRSAQRLGATPRVWLYRDHDRIVGHMGAIAVRLKLGAWIRDTAWLVDTMVLESHRNIGAGARIQVQAHDDMPFALSLGQTEEMREILLRLGWKQVAPLQVSQLLIRPERVLRGKIAAPAVWPAALGLRALSSIRGRGRARSGAQIREVATFDNRHDELWNRVACELSCAVVRDASYMNWKYVEQPGQSFIRLELVENESLLASAVLMLREPMPPYTYRRAFLVDVVAPFSDEGVMDALLHEVGATASSREADALLCYHISEPLTRALRRAGFQQRKPTRHLLVDPGGLADDVRERVLDSGSWFVTQGDSDVDRPGQ